MYEMLPMDSRRMRIASSIEGEWEQRSPTGIYGSFVCKICEARFAEWDDYAASVLRRQPAATPQGLDFGEYDYKKLTLFFLSVLWRAHASEHKFLEGVNLDAREKPLARCLFSDDADDMREFEVIPTWSSGILACGVMTPISVLIESVQYWQLYIPFFQALIKVDLGPGAICLRPFVMGSGKSLCMLEKNFTEFDEINTVRAVVAENLRKKNGKRKA